jgi:hypothetical protein
MYIIERRSSTLIKKINPLTCDAVVASSTVLSSRILRNRGNRNDIPFTGST